MQLPRCFSGQLCAGEAAGHALWRGGLDISRPPRNVHDGWVRQHATLTTAHKITVANPVATGNTERGGAKPAGCCETGARFVPASFGRGTAKHRVCALGKSAVRGDATRAFQTLEYTAQTLHSLTQDETWKGAQRNGRATAAEQKSTLRGCPITNGIHARSDVLLRILFT